MPTFKHRFRIEPNSSLFLESQITAKLEDRGPDHNLSMSNNYHSLLNIKHQFIGFLYFSRAWHWDAAQMWV